MEFVFSDLHAAEWIFLSVSFLVILQYFFYLLPLTVFKKYRLEETEPDFPVSVIICAKNEEKNLRKFLPEILTQNYPEYEVVVVNDGSEDDTELVLNEFRKDFPHLKVVHFHPDEYYKHGKKMALLVGIKSAKYEHLLFTDADCKPAGKGWIREMATGFTGQRKVVIGYSGFIPENSFLNLLIRWDCFFHGVMYLSAAIRGRAYMATGRNLAYTKSLFFENRGFSGHYHLASGDDDLFIRQVSNSENTNICIHPEAIVLTPAKKTFYEWKWQKSRHISTSYYYKTINRFRLGFYYFSLYAFYAFLITGLFLHPNLWFVYLSGWALKNIILWIFLLISSKKLNEKGLAIHSVYMEFLILVLYPLFHYLQKRYKPEKWTN